MLTFTGKNILHSGDDNLLTSVHSGVKNVSGVERLLRSGFENAFHSGVARFLHSEVDKRLTAAHNFNIYGS